MTPANYRRKTRVGQFENIEAEAEDKPSETVI
jgi:hypothetical protein